MTDAREKVRSDAAIHVAIIDAVERFRPVTPIDESRVPDLLAELERIACLVAGSSGFRILGPDEIDGPTVEKCAATCEEPHTLSDGTAIVLPSGRAYATAIRALKEKRT